MKKITLLFAFVSFFNFNAKAQTIASENFESTESELPLNWTASVDEDGFSYVYIDGYYGGCGDIQSLYSNLYSVGDSYFVSSPTYTNLSNLPLTVSYALRVNDYDSESPANYDFGNISMSYSINGGTTWTNLGTINNANFTPQNNCQTITYTIPGGITSATTQLKFKWDLNYSGIGDYEVLIDSFLVNVNQSADINTLDRSQLKMYPNPTSGILNIDYIENISELKIIDMSGRIVGSHKGQGKSNKIDVSNLNSGTYLIEIESEDNTVSTIKFLKK